MKPFTVVLLRGPRFARHFGEAEPFGLDAYVAHVTATEPQAAIEPAVAEVLAKDRRDFAQNCREARIRLQPADYIPLVVLKGRAEGTFWAWQLDLRDRLELP